MTRSMITKAKINRIFTNIPTIETERLILRKIKTSDYADMYEYSRLDEVTKYLLWSPHPDKSYTYGYIEQLQPQYRRGEFFDWAVELKSEGKMIGTCGFTALDTLHNRGEVGYVLNPAYWGRGIAPEALERVLEFAFGELGLNRVEARYMNGNVRSRRVMEKCGMTYEGTLRGHIFCKGEYRDIGVCSITRVDYSAREPF